MCCPTYCASYCVPCQPLLRAFPDGFDLHLLQADYRGFPPHRHGFFFRRIYRGTSLIRNCLLLGPSLIRNCLLLEMVNHLHESLLQACGLPRRIQTPMAQGRSTKIISIMKWVRTSRLPIKKSLFDHLHESLLEACGLPRRPLSPPASILDFRGTGVPRSAPLPSSRGQHHQSQPLDIITGVPRSKETAPP